MAVLADLPAEDIDSRASVVAWETGVGVGSCACLEGAAECVMEAWRSVAAARRAAAEHSGAARRGEAGRGGVAMRRGDAAWRGEAGWRRGVAMQTRRGGEAR